MTKKSQARIGELFSVEIPGETLTGRILLDVDAQCIAPRRLPAGSPLGFFADSFLVEVRRADEPILPGVFVHAEAWPAMGSEPVDPRRLDFPQTVTLVGPRPHFSWGEVKLPLDLAMAEFRAIETPPAISPVATLGSLALAKLGRASEIDRSVYHAPEIFDPGRLDLRSSPHGAKVHALLGARIDASYFATAMRYGFDPRRFYAGGELSLVLCPYCHVAIDPGTIECPTCRLDVRNDAPLEMTNLELALEPRKKCTTCAGPMLQTAVVCPGCKTRQ